LLPRLYHAAGDRWLRPAAGFRTQLTDRSPNCPQPNIAVWEEITSSLGLLTALYAAYARGQAGMMKRRRSAGRRPRLWDHREAVREHLWRVESGVSLAAI